MQPFDCEILHATFPTQPINTWSSVVFLVAAVGLSRRGHPMPAVAVAAAGVGSLMFHGAPSGGSSWLHDIGLYAAVAIAAIEVWRRSSAGKPPFVAAGVFAAGGVVWLLSRSGAPWCNPDSLLQGHAVWHVLSAAALVMLFSESLPQSHS